ncbi:MAG: ABZJ_00895 family protein [Rhodobacteraceae bacterium]|nr:ABZJ_00895 family protein [Paracoccaceae bacterium]
MNYLRYTIILIAATLGLAVLGYLLPVGGSWTGIVPVMIAALVEGHKYAEQRGMLPPGAERRRFAMIATAINIGMAAVYIAGMSMIDPGIAAVFSGGASGLVLGVLLVILLLVYALSWFFVQSGAKGYLRGQERLAARGAGRK